MRGDYVVVRVFGGAPALLRVWEIDGDVIYVTNDKNFGRLAAGVAAEHPFGQHLSQVYTADPKLLEQYAERQLAAEDFWQRVQPYHPQPALPGPEDVAQQGVLLQLPVAHSALQRLLTRTTKLDGSQTKMLVFDGTLLGE